MSMEPIIYKIPPTSIIDVSKLYGRMLCKSFAAAGEKDVRACLVDLVTGRRQLWAICAEDQSGPLAFFRTEIVIDETSKWLCVSALSGSDLRRWARLLGDGMTEIAKEIGCKSVRFAGREAWGRVLPDFKPIGEVDGETVFEREAV